ncbi:hypothetical protein MKW92_000399, partial [Papaver armeniacum]
MVKVCESEVYVQVQKLIKTFDEKSVENLKHFIDTLPVITKEVFNYGMNWELVEK